MNIEYPLQDGLLFLRQLTDEDATPEYLSWMADSKITQHLEVRFSPPQTVEHLRRFIAATNDSTDTLLLGMFLPSDCRHIGNIKLGPIDRHHGSGDIGLLIGDRGEWGKGHGTVAITLLAAYAFDHLGLAKLTAGCYAENAGSRRAFLKAGFVQEGCRIAQYLVDGKRQDGLLFGKVNPRIY